MNNSNWYLIRVWKQNKILFAFILFFIFLQSFFIIKRVQNFPFFIFDMYSRPIDKPETFTLFIVNDEQLLDYTKLTNIEEAKLLSHIKTYQANLHSFPNFVHQQVLDNRCKNKLSNHHYQFIKDGLSNDSTFKMFFPSWLNGNYLYTSNQYSIKQNTYRFSDKKLIQSTTILSSNEM